MQTAALYAGRRALELGVIMSGNLRNFLRRLGDSPCLHNLHPSFAVRLEVDLCLHVLLAPVRSGLLSHVPLF
jgi:hypothetical protein